MLAELHTIYALKSGLMSGAILGQSRLMLLKNAELANSKEHYVTAGRAARAARRDAQTVFVRRWLKLLVGLSPTLVTSRGASKIHQRATEHNMANCTNVAHIRERVGI